jgi:hypothetical protein
MLSSSPCHSRGCGTKAKLSDQAKVAVKNAQKNMQKNKNKRLIQIKERVECAAMDPMLL